MCYDVLMSHEYGFHLRIECPFSLPQIQQKLTLGISEMTTLTIVSQLRSYFGAIMFYGRFVVQKKPLQAPLDRLLKHNDPLKWTAE